MTANSTIPTEPAKAGLPPRPPTVARETSRCSSREHLRRDLLRRGSTLTPIEHSFLEQLLVHGNEIEVSIAREKLNDENLFFFTNSSNDEGEDDQSSWDGHDDGFGDDVIIDRESVVSSFDDTTRSNLSSPLSSGKPPRLPRLSVGRSQSSSSSHVPRLGERGSERMKVHFLTRCDSGSVHSRMWKAHESGLAVTTSASRKALIRRNSSFAAKEMVRNSSFLSVATQDLVLMGGPVNRQGEDAIFRTITTTTTTTTTTALKTPESMNKPLAEVRIVEAPIPAELARLKSDASRKSVTFKDADGPERKVGTLRVPRRIATVERATSIDSALTTGTTTTTDPSSPPPIEHAHRLESMDSGITSVPSIHRAAPLRSDSIANSSIASFSSDNEGNNGWSAPVVEISKGRLLRHPSQEKPPKPILFRKASRNIYQGEGIEVSELDDANYSNLINALSIDSVSNTRNYRSLITTSFDETGDRDGIFRRRSAKRSLSNEDMSSYFLGSSKAMLTDSELSVKIGADDDSWDMDSEGDPQDTWNVLKDDSIRMNYGVSFRILGTSGDDNSAHPHVLSPPLMEGLQNFLPFGISEENFWMRYSLLRDGASLYTLLQNVRGAKYTLLAIETSSGEVFGSFTGEPWRKSWSYFGNGEAFLWRMRKSRSTPCKSIIDQAHLESELDVFPWTGENACVQMCTNDRLAVGGGEPTADSRDEDPPYGLGLALERNLLYGTSANCATFASPPLSQEHRDGSPFEIFNVEVWTFTPCMTLEEAEKLELGKLFLQTN